jgi:hypothetical protein
MDDRDTARDGAMPPAATRLTTASTPRADRTYLDAFDPSTGKSVATCVAVTLRRATAVSRAGRGKVLEITSTVAETLNWPTAVFSGIRCDEDERGSDTVGWRCYVGKPKTYFTADGRTLPADPSDVFLVFVNADGVAYNWRWEAADADDDRLPRNHGSRFRRREYYEATKP